MRLTAICLVPLVMLCSVSQAQNPYENVDSIMRAYDRKVKSREDLWLLSYYIRQTFSEDSLRLRAAFIWITENIEYDIKAFETEDPKAGDIDYVLRKKKGVCAGYANLLKYFCDTYKIECEVVSGKARAFKSDVYVTIPALAAIMHGMQLR